MGDKVRINDDANRSGAMAQGRTGHIVDIHGDVTFVTIDGGLPPGMSGLPPSSEFGDNVLDLDKDEDEYEVIGVWDPDHSAGSFILHVAIGSFAGMLVLLLLNFALAHFFK